ncbi:hypothetical protein ATEIFO6365_0006044200 [Aspergillus terreus]|uniref:Uncharacterized protein n=1 Tax=Aspergillus terreus TaxID=33178 RepID=A0A5M3Z1J2_ASPTE|nr:hypothetical protein ATETN484_0005044000 [Aspergillus terreus]GFF17105.1 hypothetical protein ATEIFO6365_0006044200 [Aspergillus terreus]
MSTHSDDYVLPQDRRMAISLRQSLSLIRSLLSLKCLQAMDAILRVNQRTKQSPVAHWTRRQIERQEQVITDICVAILSLPILRAATKPDVPVLNLQSPSSASTQSLPQRDSFARKYGPSKIPRAQGKQPIRAGPALRPLKYIPLKRVETEDRQDEEGHEFDILDSIPIWNQYVTSDSVYSTSGKRDSSRSSAHLRQTVPLSAAQYMCMIPQTPWFSSSRQWSIDSVAHQLSGDSHAVLELNNLPRSPSSESFPGKFPMSDNPGDSSLAEPLRIRGRGATSVRPFSDL